VDLVPDSKREVGVGDEVATEGYSFGVAGFDDGLGGLWFEASGGDDVAFDTRLDDVEVGEVETVELLGDVREESIGIAVVHVVPLAGGADADGDAAVSPDGDESGDDFEQEARAVFNGAAVLVGAVVAVVLEKLIDEVAVGGVQLDAVKAGIPGALRGLTVVLDDAGDFVDGEGTVGRGLDPAAGRGDEVTGVLPVAGVDGGRDGLRAADVDVRGAAGVPELAAAGGGDVGGFADDEPAARRRAGRNTRP
jgi:hypothetical protein